MVCYFWTTSPPQGCWRSLSHSGRDQTLCGCSPCTPKTVGGGGRCELHYRCFSSLVILPKYACLRFGVFLIFGHFSDLFMSGHFSLTDYTPSNPPVPVEFPPKIYWILTVRMINILKQTAEINSQNFLYRSYVSHDIVFGNDRGMRDDTQRVFHSSKTGITHVLWCACGYFVLDQLCLQTFKKQ